MFKTLLAGSLFAGAATFSMYASQQDAAIDDRAAVERAATDYIDALYEAKPELIERSVHPDLAKFGFWREKAEDAYRAFPMTYAQLHELAGEWNATGERTDENSPHEVRVLDVLDKTAAAKVTAAWGIDFMHLAKYADEWKIVQILWQSAPMD